MNNNKKMLGVGAIAVVTAIMFAASTVSMSVNARTSKTF